MKSPHIDTSKLLDSNENSLNSLDLLLDCEDRGKKECEGSEELLEQSPFDSLRGWTFFIKLKKLNRRILLANFCQIFLQIMMFLFLVCVVAKTTSYAVKMVGKLDGVDFDSLSIVAKNLKGIDFQQWNRDLNDIGSIKQSVAGYDKKVDTMMTNVAEMLKIMREVEKYITRTADSNH